MVPGVSCIAGAECMVGVGYGGGTVCRVGSSFLVVVLGSVYIFVLVSGVLLLDWQ